MRRSSSLLPHTGRIDPARWRRVDSYRCFSPDQSLCEPRHSAFNAAVPTADLQSTPAFEGIRTVLITLNPSNKSDRRPAAGPGQPTVDGGSVVCMLFAALRDMQWRRRRLVVAIISTGLVFAMTLVLTGLANGFRVEAERTVDSMGVDAFVVKAGAAGPFLGATPFAEVDLARLAAEPGVVAAAPLATAQLTIKEGTSTRSTTAFGAPEHGPGMPRVKQGRAPSTPDEVAVSSALGWHVGDDMQAGAHALRIV